MVPTVCTLKKNASVNDPGRAPWMPPTSRNRSANAKFTASTRPAMAASVIDHGARRSTWYRSPSRSCGALTTSMPTSSCGGCAIAPEHPAPGRNGKKNLLRRVVDVLLHFVLRMASLAVGAAHVLLRVPLRLVGAAVGVE